MYCQAARGDCVGETTEGKTSRRAGSTGSREWPPLRCVPEIAGQFRVDGEGMEREETERTGHVEPGWNSSALPRGLT